MAEDVVPLILMEASEIAMLVFDERVLSIYGAPAMVASRRQMPWT